METSFFNSGLFNYLILPLLIFSARVCDVSIGTMRLIYVSKGKKNIAPFLGFFEVLIWIIAISRIMQNLNNYVCYVAYASGFATGNFVGMLIEEKLAVGSQLLRVIVSQGGKELMNLLNANNIGATCIEGQGAREKVQLIYIIVHRNDLARAVELINTFNPEAFYTIEDIREVNKGIFPPEKTGNSFFFVNILRRWRGGK